MIHDLLVERLADLSHSDLQSLAAGGLRVRENRVHTLGHDELVALCSSELRSAAGFSTLNLVRRTRRRQFPYKQILIDVADKLAPGSTPLSWTAFRLHDEHAEEEIEQYILELFEERARKWWRKLPARKREQFVDGINSVIAGGQGGIGALKSGPGLLLQQQALEQLIQAGLVTGLSKVSAGGILGLAGLSLLGQMGWLILVQTVGWMAGLKIAVFGIGGYGAMGGAVTFLGATAVGAAVALPGLVVLLDGPAYRRTVPTTIMLLAKTRLNEMTAADALDCTDQPEFKAS